MWCAGALSVAVTATTVGLSVGAVGPGHRRPDLTRPVATHALAQGPHALGVLRRWDRQRADAWAAGDPAALGRLYVAGSLTGRRDVRDLEHWRKRGLRVAGLHQQVAALSLRRHGPGRLTVLVTDRTVDGVATGGRYRVGLPRSAWLTHRVTLRRVRGTWRVVEATAQPAR
jgi:hypothetical protein